MVNIVIVIFDFVTVVLNNAVREFEALFVIWRNLSFLVHFYISQIFCALRFHSRELRLYHACASALASQASKKKTRLKA